MTTRNIKKILAIETSCDETGIALVEGQKTAGGFTFTVLKNALLSQAQLHAEYGGVYPNLAKREHEKNLPVLFKQFENEKVDAIAITQGPGLEPALWTGIEFAKKLATDWNIPLLPTNHMEGHLISSLIKHPHKLENVGMSCELRDVKLPVLALLISGGHTEFVLMKKWFEYEVIGETLDDAVGEAFDKVARMLGLPYPGGPEISKHASIAREQGLTLFKPLPRPMFRSDSCDMSFSGLKTAALYALRDMEKSRSDLKTGLPKFGPLTQDEKRSFAREFEDAVGDVLAVKTLRAMTETGAQTFVLGGGVAANTYLREKLKAVVTKEFSDVDFRLPDFSITGDNAIMIAEAALARALSGIKDDQSREIRAIGNLSIAS